MTADSLYNSKTGGFLVGSFPPPALVKKWQSRGLEDLARVLPELDTILRCVGLGCVGLAWVALDLTGFRWGLVGLVRGAGGGRYFSIYFTT